MVVTFDYTSQDLIPENKPSSLAPVPCTAPVPRPSPFVFCAACRTPKSAQDGAGWLREGSLTLEVCLPS